MHNSTTFDRKIKTVRISVILALIATILGCSKNDDPTFDGPIKAGKLSISINGINNCGGGTIITFTVPYTLSEPLKIKKLNVQEALSNGSSDNYTQASFMDDGNNIVYQKCTVFGTIKWVDFQIQVESEDGKLSNVTKGRLDKPAGAN